MSMGSIRCTVEDRALIRAMQQVAFSALLEKYQDHDTSPANGSLERITWKLQRPDTYFYQILVDGNVIGAIRVVDTILQEAGKCYLYEKMGYHRSGRQTEVNEKMTIVGYEKD